MADTITDPKCKGQTAKMFNAAHVGAHGWEEARELCIACGAQNRIACVAIAMEAEAGDDGDNRSGIYGYTTPAQRVSIERRGGVRGRDPMLLVKGQDGTRRVPPIPDAGDQWSRNHTTLARKVMKWVVENVAKDAELPTQAELAEQLKCGLGPLRRVMDALVADGTLDYTGTSRQGRGRNGTTRFIRRGNPRAWSDWLPLHLRDN